MGEELATWAQDGHEPEPTYSRAHATQKPTPEPFNLTVFMRGIVAPFTLTPHFTFNSPHTEQQVFAVSFLSAYSVFNSV
jgi:hypothetical protein